VDTPTDGPRFATLHEPKQEEGVAFRPLDRDGTVLCRDVAVYVLCLSCSTDLSAQTAHVAVVHRHLDAMSILRIARMRTDLATRRLILRSLLLSNFTARL
jgi:hypothetical protein